MKIKFKENNYVIHIKRNQELVKKLEKAGDNELEKARVVMSELYNKSDDCDRKVATSFNLFIWGFLLTFSNHISIFEKIEWYDKLVPFFAGFTGLCAAIGIKNTIGSKYYEKKYTELNEICKRETAKQKVIEEQNLKSK